MRTDLPSLVTSLDLRVRYSGDHGSLSVVDFPIRSQSFFQLTDT
jgi:hypothetical protein